MAFLRIEAGLWLKLGVSNLALLRFYNGPKLVGKGVLLMTFL